MTKFQISELKEQSVLSFSLLDFVIYLSFVNCYLVLNSIDAGLLL